MPPFKDSFQDRVGQAAEAKRKALEKLKARPPVDEAVAAERLEAARQREARAEEKRSAKAEDAKAAEDARSAEAAKNAKAEAAASVVPPTEAERKAARDAKYAARKSRK